MKRFVVLFVALLLAGVIGCDGDGDGDSTAGSEETPAEPGDTGPETTTLDSGTVVDVLGTTTLSSVTVTEPGTLKCWCTWSAIDVSSMAMRIVQTGIFDLYQPEKIPPLELNVAVNQYMVDQGGNFVITVTNTYPESADVEYRIMFTPN